MSKKIKVVTNAGQKLRRNTMLEMHRQTVETLAQLTKTVGEREFFPVDIPEGSRGKWRVKRCVVGDETVRNIKYAFDGFLEMVVSPGTYTVLQFVNGDGEYETMMSNTQFEYRTNIDFVQSARGHVMIAGLGLGMILRPLAAKDDVESITVVEKDPDVIAMIAPYYADIKKLRIIQADVFKYNPDRVFDWVWHDIWPSTSPDNLTQMHALRWRYRTHAIQQGCWAQDICKRMGDQIRALRKLKKELQNARAGTKLVAQPRARLGRQAAKA